MIPVTFPEVNVTFAKDQPEYLPLPAHRTEDGQVISCWKLSWRERITIACGGRIWLRQLTFNQALQPQLPSVESPFVKGGECQHQES